MSRFLPGLSVALLLCPLSIHLWLENDQLRSARAETADVAEASVPAAPKVVERIVHVPVPPQPASLKALETAYKDAQSRFERDRVLRSWVPRVGLDAIGFLSEQLSTPNGRTAAEMLGSLGTLEVAGILEDAMLSRPPTRHG